MDIREMGRNFKRLAKNQKGQGLVEYALILVLIAVVVIAALNFIGSGTSKVLNNVGSTLNK